MRNRPRKLRNFVRSLLKKRSAVRIWLSNSMLKFKKFKSSAKKTLILKGAVCRKPKESTKTN